MSYRRKTSDGGKLQSYYLKYWTRTRGPLFERPRMAAVRALVMCEVLTLSRGALDRRLRLRASRALRAHQGDGRPSNAPASEEQFEAARKLCAGFRRLRRESAHVHFARQADLVLELLREFEPQGRDEEDWMADHGWSELLCGVLFARDDAVRLRSATTLLCWTEPDARKVGYRKEELPEKDKKTVPHVRRDAGAPADDSWEPPVNYTILGEQPEVQARGRDGP